MGKAIEVTRMELSATALRELAAGTRDGAVVRRLLAIAVILEGHSRAEAARLNGMNRQTLRDWVTVTTTMAWPDCVRASVRDVRRR